MTATPSRHELPGLRAVLQQVLAERVAGPEGHFNAYISNLPVGVAGLPMFYGPQAVKALQYPPLTEQVRAHLRTAPQWTAGWSCILQFSGGKPGWKLCSESGAGGTGWQCSVLRGCISDHAGAGACR